MRHFPLGRNLLVLRAEDFFAGEEGAARTLSQVRTWLRAWGWLWCLWVGSQCSGRGAAL